MSTTAIGQPAAFTLLQPPQSPRVKYTWLTSVAVAIILGLASLTVGLLGSYQVIANINVALSLGLVTLGGVSLISGLIGGLFYFLYNPPLTNEKAGTIMLGDERIPVTFYNTPCCGHYARPQFL